MKATSLILVSLGILFASQTAAASPALARSWSDEAADLQSQLHEMDNHVMPDDLRFRLERFGRTATRLSTSGSEETPLPEDLGCIFRGMAEETDVQLTAFANASTGDDRQAAEERLDKMLEDAISVGEAAALVLEAGELIDLSQHTNHTGQCSAGDISSLRAADLR